jgi:hypothetical protein
VLQNTDPNLIEFSTGNFLRLPASYTVTCYLVHCCPPLHSIALEWDFVTTISLRTQTLSLKTCGKRTIFILRLRHALPSVIRFGRQRTCKLPSGTSIGLPANSLQLTWSAHYIKAGQHLNNLITSSNVTITLSRDRVMIDGVSVGDSIYSPLIHTKHNYMYKNYSATDNLHNSQMATAPAKHILQPPISSSAVPWQRLLTVEVLQFYALKSFLHILPYKIN